MLMCIVQSMRQKNRLILNDGYSFLELTIVLSLLSLFFVVTLPIVPMAIEQQKTKNFIEELAGDLHAASNEARTRQVEAMVDLFPTSSFYLLRINGKQIKKVDAPKGVTLNSNYTNQRVVFYTDGQVSQAGTIRVTDQRGRIHSIVIQLSSGRFWIKIG